MSIANGTGIAKFGLAVNRRYNSPDGEKKEDTCFVDVTAWDKLAEICSEHLAKGRLRYQSWENDDGTKRSKIEVVAQNVQFLGGRPEEESEEGASDSDIPF